MTDAESNLIKEIDRLNQMAEDIFELIRKFDLAISGLQAKRESVMLSYDHVISARLQSLEELEWTQQE